MWRNNIWHLISLARSLCVCLYEPMSMASPPLPLIVAVAGCCWTAAAAAAAAACALSCSCCCFALLFVLTGLFCAKWVCACLARCAFCRKRLPHKLHANGFSPADAKIRNKTKFCHRNE